jgi:hypothetical protein
LGFVRKTLNSTIILVWNIICLGLLINVVIHAALSIDTSFQQFGFEQPNRAVLYPPFVGLPTLVVPLVLFSHLVVLKRLLQQK